MILITLRTMKLHERFIHWVENAISTTKFSLKINGVLVGYFSSKRALRQGDPFSPFLFIIVMKMFSSLIDQRVV